MRSPASNVLRRAVAVTAATAMLAGALPAAAAPLSPASRAIADGSTVPLVQVRKGRNAAGIAAIAGLTALGIGAAIASRNAYGGPVYADPGYGYGYGGGYGGGYGYAPGYVEAPGWGGGVVYEEPAPVYGYGGGYGYGVPVYDEPVVVYAPVRRPRTSSPTVRQMNSFRDSYR